MPDKQLAGRQAPQQASKHLANPASTRQTPGRHPASTQQAPGRRQQASDKHYASTQQAPCKHPPSTRQAPCRHAPQQAADLANTNWLFIYSRYIQCGSVCEDSTRLRQRVRLGRHRRRTRTRERGSRMAGTSQRIRSWDPTRVAQLGFHKALLLGKQAPACLGCQKAQNAS
jgi:hypothetical protein